MIKQPFLPLRFYNEQSDQQYGKITVSGDWTQVRCDTVNIPPFQIKREDRPNNITQFNQVEFNTGVVTARGTGNLDIKSAEVGGTTFNWIISDGFPFFSVIAEGVYYFVISDGIETWYSEVFEVCDLYTNLLTDFTNNGFNGQDEVIANKRVGIRLCESTANGAEAYSNEFDVLYNEPLQIYFSPSIGTLGCGTAIFGDDCKFELRDAVGNVVSNTITVAGEDIQQCEELLPTKTDTVRLFVYLDNTEVAWQNIVIWMWPKKLLDYTILEWSDSINMCDILYQDDVLVDACDYVNELIIRHAHDVNPTYEIDEDATETDEKEQAYMIQVLKKFHTLKLVCGHALTDALALVRLHDNIEAHLGTGEIIDVCEFTMDNVPFTDYTETLTLQFREKECAKDNCDDYTLTECCAPNLDSVLDELANVAALPAQPCCDGERYLVDDAGTIKVFESDGAAWNHQAAEDVDCNYLIDLDTDNSDANDYPQMWWYCSDWLQLALFTFTDQVGAVRVTPATNYGIICTDCLCDNLYVQLQADDGGGWENIGEAFAWRTAAIDITIAADTYDFRVLVFQHNCDWYYFGDVNLVIT